MFIYSIKIVCIKQSEHNYMPFNINFPEIISAWLLQEIIGNKICCLMFSLFSIFRGHTNFESFQYWRVLILFDSLIYDLSHMTHSTQHTACCILLTLFSEHFALSAICTLCGLNTLHSKYSEFKNTLHSKITWNSTLLQSEPFIL